MNEAADRPIRRYVAWMVIALFVVIADQATKWAIVEWVDLYGRVPINSFINITHQQNTGAAFSFLAGAGGWQRWFFVVLATVVSAVIGVWLWRLRHRQPHRSCQAGLRHRLHPGLVRQLGISVI
jgi:signal peptidase II